MQIKSPALPKSVDRVFASISPCPPSWVLAPSVTMDIVVSREDMVRAMRVLLWAQENAVDNALLQEDNDELAGRVSRLVDESERAQGQASQDLQDSIEQRDNAVKAAQQEVTGLSRAVLCMSNYATNDWHWGSSERLY